MSIDGIIIVEKSDLNDDKFDALLYVNRKLVEIVIPSFINKIAPFAFQNCEKLTKVEFEKDSQLRLIDDCSFSESGIKKILIPSHVIKIGKFAFTTCRNLEEVKFTDDSELQVIDEWAFSSLKSEQITIPSNVTEIRECAFMDSGLMTIDFAENSKLRRIYKQAFSYTGITNLKIPSCVVKFEKNWCDELLYLLKVTLIKGYDENLKCIDDKFIIGKSNYQSNKYDILILFLDDNEKIILPSFIKKLEKMLLF